MSRRVLTTLAICALAALAAVLAADAPEPSSAAFPGLNGKIGFTSDRAGNVDVFSMNADGSAQTNLTNNAAADSQSPWSPNGALIVFYSERDQAAGEIYVMNANGSGVTRLTNNTTFDEPGGWSPDGTKIVFESWRDHPAGEIYTMNADGTAVTRLTNNTAIERSPTWSPDGSKIAFVSARDGNTEIYVMNADGSGQTRLTNNVANDLQPNWSPDAQQLAFMTDRDSGNSEIYSMFADGSGQTRLTNHVAIDADPAWSPDGTKLAFRSDRDGNAEIYVMNADGSGVTRLTTQAGQDGAPDWQPVAPSNPHGTVDLANAPAPGPTQIAFRSDRDGNGEVYVMNEDGSGQTNVTNHASADGSPSWSPDGARLAFSSVRDGDNDIYVINADGTGLVQLTTDPAVDENPTWSPDGTQLAFRSDRDGNPEIYTMNADGTSQVNRTNHPATDVAPDWSPLGTKIAFRSTRDGDDDIFAMNADGTAVTQLTTNPAQDDRPAWSPTGALIAFESDRDGDFEIYVKNADGTAVTQLTTNSAQDDRAAWSPTGAQLAFRSDRDGNEEIYVMNADGAGQTRLTSNAASEGGSDWQPPVLGLSSAPAPAITYALARPTLGLLIIRTAAGDVNGDGIDDLIVGDSGGNDGQVSVIYGSAALGTGAPTTIDLFHARPNVVITAPDPSFAEGLGRSVAIGDIDGDGVDDIVAATFLEPTGRVYVVYGENDWPGSIDLMAAHPDVEVTRIDAVDANDRMDAVAAGNISGSSAVDLILGARSADGPSNGRLSAGEAYIFNGPLSRPASGGTNVVSAAAANATIYGVDPGDRLGWFVGVGSSISGDANAELYLGAPEADAGQGSIPVRGIAGEVEVLFGPVASGPRDLAVDDADVIVVGADADDFLGADGSGSSNNVLTAVTGSGSGLGNTDFQAGEFFSKQGPFTTGTVTDMAAAGSRLRVFGADQDDYLGFNYPLDLNGDGHQDILMGADLADGLGPTPGSRANAGEAHVLYGSSGPLVSGTIDLGAPPPYILPYLRILGAAAADLLGAGLTAGDFNGDGKEDAVIVALGADYGGRSETAKMYVFLSDTPRLKLDATPGGAVDLNRNVHIGESFSIGLRIEDVPALVGLRGFDVQLAYNDAYLEGVSIAPGDFFNALGAPFSCSITTIGGGTARLACSYNGPAPVPGPAGRGDLLTVSFRARTTSVTSTPVTITSATLTEPARSTNYTGVTTAGITLGLELIDTAAGGGAGCDDSDADGCPAASLNLSAARGLAPGGGVFVADTGSHVIRRLEGDTSFRVAGAEGVSGYVDGFSTTARFDQPSGIDIDSAGNLYVADAGNNRVRKITPAGLVTTIAGGGGGCAEPCSALQQSLSNPRDVAADAFGNVYVADTTACRVRKIDPMTGLITTVAGTGTCGFVDGAVATAQLNAPEGVAVEPFTNVSQTPGILVGDTGNDRIRRVANGQVTTIAGGGPGCVEPCAATSAQLQEPRGLSIDGSGRIFLANSDVDNVATANNRVRRIDPNGMITTVAGGGAGCVEPCPALQQTLDTTNDVVLDENIFAATDELVKVVFSAGDVRSRTSPALSPCVATGNNAGDTALMFAPLLGLAFVSAGWRWRRRRLRG